jgi:hypothetical protein
MNHPVFRRVQGRLLLEGTMSASVEFLARNPGTMNPDIPSPDKRPDLAALEKRFGDVARISTLEKPIAELERQNAKTRELTTGLLSVLAAPAALMLFSPQTWVVWFAWLYVIAVGYELLKRMFRFLLS